MTDEDLPLVRAILAAAREDAFAELGLTDAQLGQLLDQQATAQLSDYRARYPNADYDLILMAGEIAGWIVEDRTTDGIHIIDIALLPRYRSRGLGTAILMDIGRVATERRIPVHLSVAVTNTRAYSLYLRLGFVEVGRTEVYIAMTRHPEAA